MVFEKTDILLSVSRTLVVSQGVFEARNLTLDEVSNTVWKNKIYYVSNKVYSLLARASRKNCYCWQYLEEQVAAFRRQLDKGRFSANIRV